MIRAGGFRDGFWTAEEYIREEVRRQGHDLRDPLDGGLRVEWMTSAWEAARRLAAIGPLTIDDVAELGRLVERQANANGFRDCHVWVGPHLCPPPETVRPSLVALLPLRHALDPLEWYRRFQLIHPFRDGNGRTGKVLLAWLSNTFDRPYFPPANLFGEEIGNP